MSSAPRTVRPIAALTRFVTEIRVLERIPEQGLPLERLADGTASLLLRTLEEDGGDVSIAGPRTRALFKTAPPAKLAILVDFKPGAALPFFGVPLDTLTDRIVHLQELWGTDASRVLERLGVDRAPGEALDALQQVLVERVRDVAEPASVRLARRAVQVLSTRPGPLRVGELASELGVTARHLRRVFGEAVGVGPKELARMIRLKRAATTIAGQANWTEVATTAGFYDQSHLIAEFRELVGLTPSAWVKRAGKSALRW